MKHWLTGVLVLALAVGLGACREPAAPPPSPGEPAFEVDPAEAPMEQRLDPTPPGETVTELPSPFEPDPPAPAPEAPTPTPKAAAPADVEGAVDANHAALIGTEWEAKGAQVHFVSTDQVHLQGGPVQVFPEGIEAQYTYTPGGAIELTLMGARITGNWDGQQLLIDGETATRR